MNKLFLLIALFSVNANAKPVSINSADAKTISESLTGVSLKTAEAIVADRIQNGNFKSADDLKRVLGIGEKIIALNKADILIAPPKARTGRHHERGRERHGHTDKRPATQN